jgi:hypothetical protein
MFDRWSEERRRFAEGTMTPEELVAWRRRSEARYAVSSRIAFLASQLTDGQMDGLVVLIEAALRDREALAELTPAQADQALSLAIAGQLW